MGSNTPGSRDFGFDLDKFQNVSEPVSSFERGSDDTFYFREWFLRIACETRDLRNQESNS